MVKLVFRRENDMSVSAKVVPTKMGTAKIGILGAMVGGYAAVGIYKFAIGECSRLIEAINRGDFDKVIDGFNTRN